MNTTGFPIDNQKLQQPGQCHSTQLKRTVQKKQTEIAVDYFESMQYTNINLIGKGTMQSKHGRSQVETEHLLLKSIVY